MKLWGYVVGNVLVTITTSFADVKNNLNKELEIRISTLDPSYFSPFSEYLISHNFGRAEL